MYLLRIYDLSRDLKGAREEDITPSDNRRNAMLYLVFMVLLFAGFFWLTHRYNGMLLPQSASEHGKEIDWLMNINLWVVTAVFLVINFLLFTLAFRFVREKRAKAEFFPHNTKLELVWTIIPSTLL